ncbi:glucose-1-phosphate adenylyltransferase [Sulfuriflexus mobilis]|uniref:glucose-1-phosphate adenylyltransferase n=1 Tax=Sulfuriflexus mobilis TaxID=1811807 RepID=UPI0022B2AB09|nr:glucose-1-phosphate adenylyltransferase [Sulfuriflexus mobilis]
MAFAFRTLNSLNTGHSMIEETLAIILAGGAGESLSPLTDERTKAAVPFGGKYRIIDFPLSNCLHSGLRRALVLTQYKSHSLQKHLRDAWSIYNPELGEYITAVPPQMRTGSGWYAGTADAIYQNLYLLERNPAKYVIVLSGDNIYRMDYAVLLQQHLKNNADVTMACVDSAAMCATGCLTLQVDDEQRVRACLQQAPDDVDKKTFSSLGIYIFSKDLLVEALSKDHEQAQSSHGLATDVISGLIDSHRVYAYEFGASEGRVSQDGYWRNIADLDDFYEANMDLLKPVPPIDLYQRDWPIRTHQPQYPPARTVPGVLGNEGISINSIISSGTVIAGGSVQKSILFSNVHIGDEAVVEDSILFDGVKVGDGAHIRNCIIDKDVVIAAATKIGFSASEDGKQFKITPNGVIAIGKSRSDVKP